MFTHFRTEGFILRKEDIGEADRIFTIYSKDFGKLKLTAKAERKITSKLRSGLELFYLSDLEFIQGKAIKTITDAMLIDDFNAIREDLAKLSVTYKISEVIDELISGQEADKNIWDLLSKTFFSLKTGDIRPELVYCCFFWKFVSLLGYSPKMEKIGEENRKNIQDVLSRDLHELGNLNIKKGQTTLLLEASENYLSMIR